MVPIQKRPSGSQPPSLVRMPGSVRRVVTSSRSERSSARPRATPCSVATRAPPPTRGRMTEATAEGTSRRVGRTSSSSSTTTPASMSTRRRRPVASHQQGPSPWYVIESETRSAFMGAAYGSNRPRRGQRPTSARRSTDRGRRTSPSAAVAWTTNVNVDHLAGSGPPEPLSAVVQIQRNGPKRGRWSRRRAGAAGWRSGLPPRSDAFSARRARRRSSRARARCPSPGRRSCGGPPRRRPRPARHSARGSGPRGRRTAAPPRSGSR